MTSFPNGNMGVMIFQLPPTLADETFRQELQRASVAGGQDNMPYRPRPRSIPST